MCILLSCVEPSLLIIGQWPGYGVLARQINVKDHAKNPQPVSKHKLGQRVAKAIQSIMEASSLACAAWREVTHLI